MSAPKSTPVLKPQPSRKRKREEIPELCILCNEQCDENKSNISPEAWERIKDRAQDWKGLHKFGTVYDSVNWDAGPNGVYFHKVCRTALAAKRGLQKALRRKDKEQKQQTVDTQETHSKDQQQAGRSSRGTGLLHEKNLCIWCMKPEDLNNSKTLCIIQQWNAWNTFKSHTIHLEDDQMRERILTVIDSTPDPFASEIRYHRSCWMKYVKPHYKHSDSSGDRMHLQNVQLTEVRQMFFRHVRTVVLEMNEPRTLQGLLVDYNQMSANFGFETVIKTSTIKQMLQNEFKDNIGFLDRFHKNQSTIVYDASAGGSYIEAAIYYWGISDEQLLNNVARRLRKKFTEEVGLSWPPRVDELENIEEPHELLRQLLTWLKDPDSNYFTEACHDPQISALASLLFSFITGKRTSFKTSNSQHKIHPYKTVKRGQPAVRKEIDISLQTSDEQRKRGVMHVLARLDIAGKNIPADEQKVGSFAGFQANIHEYVVKSTAYYFLTFPKPPQKSVVHEVMCRMVTAAGCKSMPCIQLVDDQPVYALIIQLKNENPEKFQLILPFLGPFHAHISFISAINKRFHGSGLSEIVVAADIISDGSVDQALRGKHYNRGIRCLSLMYEVLIRRIIFRGVSEGLNLSSELKSRLEVLRSPCNSSKEQLQAIADDLLMDAEFKSF